MSGPKYTLSPEAVALLAEIDADVERQRFLIRGPKRVLRMHVPPEEFRVLVGPHKEIREVLHLDYAIQPNRALRLGERSLVDLSHFTPITEKQTNAT